MISSELTLTEIPRAVHRFASRDRHLTDRLLKRAGEVIDRLALHPLERDLLAAAGALRGSV